MNRCQEGECISVKKGNEPILRSDEWESGLEGDEWDNESMPRGDE